MTEDFIATRIKPKLPSCPACGQLARHDHDDWFDCSKCKLHFNVPDYSIQMAIYQQYVEERRLDQLQLDKEIIFAEASSHLLCPQCGEEGIGLFPGGFNTDGLDTAMWMCVNCDAEIDSAWMQGQFASHGLPLLTCVRCGMVYDMTVQHICHYGEVPKGEPLGIISFALK